MKQEYRCGFDGTKMDYVGFKKRKRTIQYYFRCPKCKAERVVIEYYKDDITDEILESVKNKSF